MSDMQLKILFVSSGNSKTFPINPLIKAQASSIENAGVIVEHFTIKGKGLIGYLKNIKRLKDFLNKNNFDIVHAHYSLIGWVCALSNLKIPLVVSYMGCDTYGDYNDKGRKVFSSYIQILLGKLLQPFAKAIIVKSENLEKYIYMKYKTYIVPNGVDFKIFHELERSKARDKLNLNQNKKYILFLGNKENKRKNYKLLKKSINHLNINVEVINPYPVRHQDIPLYLNACDCLVLTSFNEGSPNVIKEAMATNCPIVSTDVGDVKEVFGDAKGCLLTSFNPEDLACKIEEILSYSSRSTGRENIRDLEDSKVAKKIINIYKTLI